jgi:hypothetical protein
MNVSRVKIFVFGAVSGALARAKTRGATMRHSIEIVVGLRPELGAGQ